MLLQYSSSWGTYLVPGKPLSGCFHGTWSVIDSLQTVTKEVESSGGGAGGRQVEVLGSASWSD